MVPISLSSDFRFYSYFTVTKDLTGETRDKNLAAKGRRIFFQHFREKQADYNNNNDGGGQDQPENNFNQAYYFFEGSELFAVRPLPFVTDLPYIIKGPDENDKIEVRLISMNEFIAPETIMSGGAAPGNCKVPTSIELIKYASLVLSRRMAEEYKKWDQHFLALQSKQEHGSLTVYQGAKIPNLSVLCSSHQP